MAALHLSRTPLEVLLRCAMDLVPLLLPRPQQSRVKPLKDQVHSDTRPRVNSELDLTRCLDPRSSVTTPCTMYLIAYSRSMYKIPRIHNDSLIAPGQGCGFALLSVSFRRWAEHDTLSVECIMMKSMPNLNQTKRYRKRNAQTKF